MIQPKRYRRKPTEGSFIEFRDDIMALEGDGNIAGEFPVVEVPGLVVRHTGHLWEVWNELHGSWISVRPGDFIRVDQEGDIYPVDQVTFESTYEPVDE